MDKNVAESKQFNDCKGGRSEESNTDYSASITIQNPNRHFCKTNSPQVLTVGCESKDISPLVPSEIDSIIGDYNDHGSHQDIQSLFSENRLTDVEQSTELEITSSIHKNEPLIGRNLANENKLNFVPVNLVVSVVPELFNERFPKLDERYEERYNCKWCIQSVTRNQINRFTYSKIQLLLNHYMEKHKEIHIKDYQIQCQDCSAYFYHETKLEKHLVDGLCIKNFKRPQLTRLRQNITMKSCDYCEIVFISEKRFKKHLLKNIEGCIFEDIEHPMELGNFDYMKCKFCEKTFLFEQDFLNHTKPGKNLTISPFKCKGVSLQIFDCSVCSQRYLKRQTFLKHIHLDHTAEEFNLKCERCDRYFRLEEELEEHKVSNSGYPFCVDLNSCRTIPRTLPDVPYLNLKGKRCPLCRRNFKDGRIKLLNHLKKRHSDYNLSNLTCPECHESFITHEEFEDHMTKWKCPFCENIFSMRSTFIFHCRHKHWRNIICNICNEAFPNDSSLQIHLKRHHSKQIHECSLKICPFCDKTCKSEQTFYIHVKNIHAYQDPDLLKEKYTCDLCAAGDTSSFLDQGRLNRHIETVHKKAQETECDICHRKFSQKATMMRHRRIHLDIKPFKCGICELTFTQKTGMRAHEVRHYNKDGTLKSAEEIKTQVEIIKLQREKQSDPKTSDKEISRSSKRKSKTLKKHSKTEKIVCELCFCKFVSRDKYNSHSCKVDKSQRDDIVDEQDEVANYNFNCAICEKEFVSWSRLQTHRCRRNVKY